MRTTVLILLTCVAPLIGCNARAKLMEDHIRSITPARATHGVADPNASAPGDALVFYLSPSTLLIKPSSELARGQGESGAAAPLDHGALLFEDVEGLDDASLVAGTSAAASARMGDTAHMVVDHAVAYGSVMRVLDAWSKASGEVERAEPSHAATWTFTRDGAPVVSKSLRWGPACERALPTDRASRDGATPTCEACPEVLSPDARSTTECVLGVVHWVEGGVIFATHERPNQGTECVVDTGELTGEDVAGGSACPAPLEEVGALAAGMDGGHVLCAVLGVQPAAKTPWREVVEVADALMADVGTTSIMLYPAQRARARVCD